MLEFSDDEVLLLHNGMIVYLIEFDKYFGDMNFNVRRCWGKDNSQSVHGTPAIQKSDE
ncbi:hypothetical protein DPMN_043539 [Dreissena polymorpha]|uniref:Uncharacterized protein n=1 Tax=Dreissena polymorpha TaxID=45954 RepID=A0A9D4D0Q1_DREPO|nr:hypothetical protein DPMN_043539 [Dreissena polymorpha]